jgi:phosphoserine aminotransferase
MTRVHNFSAGPSALPIVALQRARDEMLDYAGSGMSIMEQSHRAAVYEGVHDEALALVRELMSVPDTHDILFLQGGASQQFAQVPMNLLHPGRSADYVVTGVWGKKAIKEAKLVGQARVAKSTEEGDGKFFRVPGDAEIERDAQAAFFHVTTNNTVMGTQFSHIPESPGVPVVLDASSDIMGRPLDVSKYGLIYAGAQKNLGPSGITLVIIDKQLIETGRRDIPLFFQYRTHAEAKSLYNTIPTFGVYMLRNVMLWLKELGGVPAIYKTNQEKAARLYRVLAERSDLYQLKVEKESRSIMNVTWNLATPDAEKACVAAATKAGLIGLKGHRIVGGMRASIYNAVPLSSVDALCEFLGNYRP